MTVAVLLFLLLVGPLALLAGADSRSLDDHDRRGWWPGGGACCSRAPRRPRPGRVRAIVRPARVPVCGPVVRFLGRPGPTGLLGG
ncbi:MAG TPA: hypothetical protein VFD01_05600 [Candidatus Dormibacteraeota bacterium]|nr:hypothetical protein [Candidatus Dormibacteraeota bacterium]